MPHSPSTKPKLIRSLRDAALQEVASTKSKTLESDELRFDQDHAATPRTHNTRAAEEFDAENWVAKYPGQNSPHIGNGSGGIRR